MKGMQRMQGGTVVPIYCIYVCLVKHIFGLTPALYTMYVIEELQLDREPSKDVSVSRLHLPGNHYSIKLQVKLVRRSIYP